MKNSIVIIIFAFALSANTISQEIVPLYEGKAPGSETWDYNEVEFADPVTRAKMLRNVVDPTLEVFRPEESASSGTAVIICPGGGNVWLSYENEGTAVAEWFVKKGITAFVLKYRLNKTPVDEEEFKEYWDGFGERIKSMTKAKETEGESKHVGPPKTGLHNYGGDDGLRALEFVREHATQYNIKPNKIGIIGFSAGAGVAMYTILNSTPDNMPDFAAVIYGGWLSGSEVPKNAPPLFILCAADDPIASGSPDLYKAWRASGKSAELHIYSKGGHGFGMEQRRLPVNNWIERCYDWMKISRFK